MQAVARLQETILTPEGVSYNFCEKFGKRVTNAIAAKSGNIKSPLQLSVLARAQCEEELGGGDDLAGVALGVVGDVDEEAADGGGELLAADRTREFEVGGGQIADTGCGVVEGFVKFVEDSSNGGGGFRFRFQGSELRVGQLIVLGVGEEAIDAAGDVTHVKSNGRKSVRLGVKVFQGETEAPVVDVF